MRPAKLTAIVGLAVVVVTGVATAWPGEAQPAPAAQIVAEVEYGALSRELRFRGTVEYLRSAEIVAPASGVLSAVQVSLGSSISEGAVVARIAAPGGSGSAGTWMSSFYPSQKDAIAAEREALDVRQETERAALEAKRGALADLGDYSDKRIDLQVIERQARELETRHRAERSALAARMATLEQQRHDMISRTSLGGPGDGYGTVRAPFSGVVTALSVPHDDSPVEVGQHILTIVDDSALTVAISVAPDTTYTLSKHPTATCFLIQRQVRRECTLQDIVRDASGYKASYRISGEADQAFGEPAEVVLQIGSRHGGLRVPRAALRYGDSGPAVRVVRGGRTVEVGVRVGFEGNVEAIIQGNLRVGEKVVIDG